jgi:hypothetical protein
VCLFNMTRGSKLWNRRNLTEVYSIEIRRGDRASSHTSEAPSGLTSAATANNRPWRPAESHGKPLCDGRAGCLLGAPLCSAGDGIVVGSRG